MHNYVLDYNLPVLVVMAILLFIASRYHGGKSLKWALMVAGGFLLGWVSAYLSLYYYHLYK
jgi:hypothetical protein